MDSAFLRDLQRDMPAARCAQCQGEVYREDTLYLWEGVLICEECLEDKFSALTAGEKARLLGAQAVAARSLVPPGRGE